MELSDFKPLTLGDKSLFDQYFTRFPPEISEYTFTNLYMWRSSYQYEWSEENEILFLIARKFQDNLTFFPPIGGNIKKAVEMLLDLAQKEESELHILKSYLPEEMSESELQGVVDEAIKEAEAQTMKDMGKVMKLVLSKVEGKADNKLVSELVKKSLS